MVKVLAGKLGMWLNDYHFCVVQRLPSNMDAVPIIVKLNCLEKKNKLTDKAKFIKPTGNIMGKGNHPIFISEHLTTQIVVLLKVALQFRGEGFRKSGAKMEKCLYAERKMNQKDVFWICRARCDGGVNARMTGTSLVSSTH